MSSSLSILLKFMKNRLTGMETVNFSLKCLIFCTFIIGAYRHFSPRQNMCTMTYMYQQPEYIVVRKSTACTSLQWYSHFVFARKFWQLQARFIEMLFDSCATVRSLASVSMTKAATNKSPFHFNYFAIDFNDELSALYGNFLFKQTEFTSICIKTILALYKDTLKRPTSIIIVGHSMGGMIARAVFTLGNFNHKSIELIITQATPHSEPVFTPDCFMVDFYNRVNEYWHQQRNSSLNHVNLVSINGGRDDLMVRSDLTNMALKKAWTSPGDISITSNAIPGVWVGMDHLCIVWCNQLVLAIVRTTFKLIDSETMQLISDTDIRHRLLTRLLIEGAHMKSHSLKLAAKWVVPLSYEDFWTVRSPGRWEYRGSVGNNISAPSTLLMTTSSGPQMNRHLFVMTKNLMLEPWIFTCDHDGDLCHVTGDLSCKTFHVPANNGVEKIFHCSKIKSKHIVIKLPSEDHEKIEVVAETFENVHRTFEASWPALAVGVDFRLPKNSILNTVKLSGFSDTWEAYKVQLKSQDLCSDSISGVIHLWVPWSIDDIFEVIDTRKSDHSIVLHSARPLEYTKTDTPEIRFYLNPKCEYTISVTFDLFEIFAQIVRFYIYYCPAFIAALTLLSVSSQLTNKLEERKIVMILSWCTLIKSLAKVYILTTILDWIFGNTSLIPEIYKRWSSMPVVFLVYVFSNVAVAVFLLIIRTCAYTMRQIIVILPWKSSVRMDTDYTKCKTSFLNAILIVVILLIGYFLCGAVAILFTGIIMMTRSNCGTPKSNLHIIVCLIWGLVFLFNSPTLIVKLVNFRHEKLDADPTLLPSYFMIIVLFIRGQFIDNLRKSKITVTWLSRLQSMLATAILLFGVDNLHRIQWFLIADCLLIFYWPIFL